MVKAGPRQIHVKATVSIFETDGKHMVMEIDWHLYLYFVISCMPKAYLKNVTPYPLHIY